MKLKAKILSLIVAFACLVSMFSMPSYAADEIEEQIIVAAGQGITDSGYWKIGAFGKVSAANEGNYNIAYDAQSNTLTLRNAEFENKIIGAYAGANFDMATGIVSTRDLNIKLIGENSITVETEKYQEATGIFNVYGSTYFSGEGSLTINIDTDNAISTAIVAGYGEIHIDETTVNINAEDCSSQGTCGIISNKIAINKSDVNISFKNSDNSYGVFSNPTGNLLEVIDSDLNITFEGCTNANAIEIFSVTFKDSNVNIKLNNQVKSWEAINHGIYTYSLLIQNSYVDVDIISLSGHGYNSVLTYAICMIDNFVDRSHMQINQYHTGMKITPDGFSFKANNIDLGLCSVFSQGMYDDSAMAYYDASNSASSTNGDNWNFRYDIETNTLYLKNLEATKNLNINGYVNISLVGENKLYCSGQPALSCNEAPVITGSGTLTLVSDSTGAIEKSGGIILGENTTAVASLSADGAAPEAYDNSKAEQYKWVQITAANEPEQNEEELNFFEKIIQFFRNLFQKIFSIFS